MDNKFIISVLEKVFPVGTEIHLDAKVDPKSSRFWVVPGRAGEPRWILPGEYKYGWPFLQQWTPYDFSSRIKWKTLMVAYKGKSLGYVPGIVPVRIHVPEGKNWGHLGWSLRKPPVPVIYVGTPGSNRKAIIGMINSQKNGVASICKVPLGLTAATAISHEVDILNQLAQEKPGRAPRNLFSDNKKGISAQNFITGSPTGRQLTEDHVNYLVDLAIPGKTITLSEVIKNLGPQIHALKEVTPDSRAFLQQILAGLDDTSPLPAVWEHGDFAPWNLKNRRDDSLQAMDWEAASRKGLPLFDLVFFRSIQTFLFGEKKLFPRLSKTLIRQYMEKMFISPMMTAKIVQACIIQDWFRCHTTGNILRAEFLLSQLRNQLQRQT